MLDSVFMQVLDMTKTASIVILIILLVRLLLKKAPKVFSYVLWSIVLFRLLCPVSIELDISAVPEFTPVAYSYTLEDEPVSFYGASEAAYQAVGDVLNGGIDIQHVRTTERDEDGNVRYATANWWEVMILFGQYVWLVGIAVMFIYSTFQYYKLRKRLTGSVPLRDNIFLSDYITSPFVMGLFRPKIYLPSALGEGEQEYIILHEQQHIKRLDHVTKALAFLALCVHWFNPLVWLAFVLSGNDMEMSCDEAVIRKMGENIRADYSSSLLSLATGRRLVAGTPLAFGEGDTEGRIRNLAKYKKPALLVVIIAVAVSIVLAVCFMSDPKKSGEEGYFDGVSEISEFRFPMDKLDVHTYTVVKGDNDYFVVNRTDLGYHDINSMLEELDLNPLDDEATDPIHEIVYDATVKIESNSFDKISVCFYDGYQKLHLKRDNSKYSVRSKDYAVLNPETVSVFFEYEEYKNYTTWAFDLTSSAWGHGELYLYVDEKFEINGEAEGEGVFGSVTNEENGLRGVSWRPDVTQEPLDEYKISIPVAYEGKTSSFKLTLTKTGKRNFCTYYNVYAEGTVIASSGNGYEYLLSFAEDKHNMQWYYSPMLSATGYSQLSFVLGSEYDIIDIKANSGETRLTDYVYKSDRKKAVWSPDYDKLSNMYETKITVYALEGDKELEFKVKVIPMDGTDEYGSRTFRIEPQNCKATNYRWATYLLEEK